MKGKSANRWQDLLKRYIQHVYDEEGVSFVRSLNSSHSRAKFTEEEVKLLEKLDQENLT